MLGHTEIMLVVLVVVVLFGASAIPKFARSIGQAKREFQKGIKEEEMAAKDGPEARIEHS